MRYASILCAALTLSAAATAAHAGPTFSATLSGANERPVPVETTGTGSAVAELLGGPGAYVLDFNVSFANLTSPTMVVGGSSGHLHRSVNPPGQPPTEQTGPIVFPLPGLEADQTADTSTGQWRYDDATNPLTDELAAALLNGEIYVNVHTMAFMGGEVRGQLVPTATAIPLPAALPIGAIGLIAAGAVSRRMRGRAG